MLRGAPESVSTLFVFLQWLALVGGLLAAARTAATGFADWLTIE
jgi:hypothetical protein